MWHHIMKLPPHTRYVEVVSLYDATCCRTVSVNPGNFAEASVAHALIANHDSDDPITVNQALTGPDKISWQEAIDNELQALTKTHGTMIEVEIKSLPPETKILGTKYVFKTKYKNGLIYDKRKATD